MSWSRCRVLILNNAAAHEEKASQRIDKGLILKALGENIG